MEEEEEKEKAQGGKSTPSERTRKPSVNKAKLTIAHSVRTRHFNIHRDADNWMYSTLC